MNTKLIAALVVAGVLAIAVVGLVAAQVVTTSAPNGTTGTAQNGGFFGWIGRCMGFRSAYNEAYVNGAQAPAYVGPAYVGQPENITVTNPYTGATTTYQGYYGYGCGGMMGYRP
jgi:hypothetical protein